jgi:hypothetical protein
MNRAKLKQELAEAEQCIADGKRYVELQRAIVAKLVKQGHGTEKARSVLKTLQDTLAQHIEYRDQLKLQVAHQQPRVSREIKRVLKLAR